MKATVAWTQGEFGYTEDLLDGHVDSTASAPTAGVDLFDTDIDDHPGEDYDDIDVRVGWYAENLVTHVGTTVVAVVSGTQLTLAADVGLGAGSPYALAATHGVDATGGDFDPATTGEEIIQFVYVNLGTGVAGWILTDAAAYYAGNVLTAAPAWSNKLTRAAARVFCGGSALFQAIAVSALNPALAVIAMDSTSFNGGTFVANGGVYTTDTGANWTVSLYGAIGGVQPTENSTMRGLSVDQDTGAIYAIRGFQWPYSGPNNRKEIWKSVDDGANFVRITNTWVSTNRTSDRGWIPARGAQLYMQVDNEIPAGLPLASTDTGATWASAQPAGYTNLLNGIVGHYADGNDVVCMFDRTADSEVVIARSSDGAASFVDITDDVIAMFDEHALEDRQPVLPDGWPWPPDSDILGCMNGATYHGDSARKLFYSDDNGTIWFNKTCDWVASVGGWDWGDWGGRCGFMPLPRVGINI